MVAEKLITNKEEEKNLKSYESETAFRNFHAVGLRDLERELIAKYFTANGSRILDVGCGYGRTTKPLADMGYSVVGIDVVPRMIDAAHAEYPTIDFQLMSATDLAFPDNSFDGVLFSFNGIDYIYPEERRLKALQEIRRVLKPGGVCILTSHNRATLVTRPRFRAVKLFWQTLKSGLLFSPYIVAPYGDGDQITFCRMPVSQVKDFRSAGFEVLLVTGKRHKSWLMMNFFETWPYFVIRKR